MSSSHPGFRLCVKTPQTRAEEWNTSVTQIKSQEPLPSVEPWLSSGSGGHGPTSTPAVNVCWFQSQLDVFSRAAQRGPSFRLPWKQPPSALWPWSRFQVGRLTDVYGYVFLGTVFKCVPMSEKQLWFSKPARRLCHWWIMLCNKVKGSLCQHSLTLTVFTAFNLLSGVKNSRLYRDWESGLKMEAEKKD